jgi:hypothetical protein
MLEYPTLLLLPWARGPGQLPGRRRTILDPATGKPLGFARPRATSLPPWLRWLLRSALEIVESEDESLLCTLSCPWFVLRGWEVSDADEHPVGALRGHLILDRYDRQLASVARAEGGGHRFLSPDGYELGFLGPAAADMRLTFAEHLAGDPFARMMLLAAALALTNGRTT